MTLAGRLILLFFISIMFCAPLSGQDEDYFSEDYIRHKDYIYKDYIKSAILYKEGWQMSPPVVKLKGSQKLILSFDDLQGDVRLLA